MGGHTAHNLVQLKLSDAQKFAVTNTRRMDQETSIAAAEKVAARAPRHRLLTLRTHYEHPNGLDDFALAKLTGIQQTSIGKRRKELVDTGMIEKTDLYAFSPTGSKVIIWKITAKGKEEAERLNNA